MQSPGDDGSNSQHGAAPVRSGDAARREGSSRSMGAAPLKSRPSPAAELSTSSGTIAYVPHSQLTHNADSNYGDSQVEGGEGDRTVISQRPVAAPEEFYRSMPLSELASMLEGRQLDHFAVEQMIGGGGMGAVFRGRDLRLDRVVAIKVIPAAKRDPETLRRFRLEAQAAAKLDHPNIARVYYVGEAEQWNYIVFEFIDGVNIRDLVDMEGALGVDDAVFYTRQVAEALQHAYERAVVHRDIKPSNVLVTATGAAKVVDMGLARNTALDKSTADETASGVTLGTFDYISPEQARNPRDADVRSDLYSLGCTLFYMLTGNPPFPEGTALQKLLSHGSQAPPDPRGWRDDLSDELFEITMKLMAKRPTDRYQTPAELISDLALLAEVEDLPRSQSTGTVLVTPSIAQHSLIETNLPWLVAVAFLLGSTLWLASVEKLSNAFEISELNFPAPSAEALSDSNSATSQSVSSVAPAPLVTTQSDTYLVPQTLANSTVVSDSPLNSPRLPISDLPSLSPAKLPSAETLNPLPPTSQSPTSQASVSPSSAVSTSPSVKIASRGLVVCAEQPTDVSPERWESSLASAVQRLDYDVPAEMDGSYEIEVRGRVVLRRALEVSGLNLRIVSGTSAGAVIEVAEELMLASNETNGAVNLYDSKLKLRGIAFEARIPDKVSLQRQGLFAMRGSSQLDLESCTVTVRDLSSSNAVYIFSCNDALSPTSVTRPRQASLASSGATAGFSNSANAPSTSVPSDSIVIRTAMSVFRGDTSMVRLNITDANVNDRVDLSFTNTLAAINGTVLELHAPTGEPQPQRFVRMLCDQSTLASEQAFATLNYTGDGTPLVGLLRTSQSCIYWSRPQVPHIEINGAPRQSLLGNFNLLLLQGMNNLYDASIEELCQAFQGTQKIAAFGFVEASTNGWLAERGNESRVRWQDANFPKLPLRDATPRDFAVADLLFVPGIAPKKLPIPDSP